MAIRYWLFQVLYDWDHRIWDQLVKTGIAAHHYPEGWTNAQPNVARFQEMRRGDLVVAAFTRHRFAGYGELASSFYQNGPSLKFKHAGKEFAFRERFDCAWTPIPTDRDPPFIRCRDLKAQGFKIDLERGRGAKQIDKASFQALRDRLNAVGAKPAPQRQR